MGAFVISPLPSVLSEELPTAGPLGSMGITPLPRYYGPSRHPLAFRRLPGCSGYAAYLAPPISRRGEEGFSSCSTCPCHRAVAITPPKGPPHRPEFRRSLLPSPCICGLGLGFFKLSRPPLRSLSLRPGDSLTILMMALPMGFKALISLLSAILLQGLWSFPWRACLAAPAGHRSLGWTHKCPFVPTMSTCSTRAT